MKIGPIVTVMLIITCVTSASTLAYFSDSEASTGNTFTAGTLDLKVADWGESFGDGVTATWTMTNMTPGVTTTGGLVILKNSGSTAADHVEINFSHSIDEATNPVESDTNPNSAASDLAKWIEITTMFYWRGTTDFVNLKAQLTDVNKNGFIDLDDVTRPGNSDVLDNLSAPSQALFNHYSTLTIFLKFNAEATNDIQGDILTTTVIFTLNQVDSQ